MLAIKQFLSNNPTLVVVVGHNTKTVNSKFTNLQNDAEQQKKSSETKRDVQNWQFPTASIRYITY